MYVQFTEYDNYKIYECDISDICQNLALLENVTLHKTATCLREPLLADPQGGSLIQVWLYYILPYTKFLYPI